MKSQSFSGALRALRFSQAGPVVRAANILCVLVVLAATPKWARADEDGIPKEAQARIDEAVSLMKNRKNEEARQKYLQSLALFPSAKALVNLAIVEEDMGRFADSIAHLKAYSKHPKADPARLIKVREEYIPYLMTKTGHLRVLCGDGQAIVVDGVSVGVGPVREPIDVDAGPRRIEVAGRVVEVSVAQGETKDVDLRPPATETPKAAVAREPLVSTSSSGGPGLWVPVTLLSVGVAGIVTGAVFGTLSNAAKQDADDIVAKSPAGICKSLSSSACTDLQDKLDSRNRNDTLSKVFLVGGGVFVAAGVVSFAVWPKEKKTGARIVPHVGGISIAGEF